MNEVPVLLDGLEDELPAADNNSEKASSTAASVLLSVEDSDAEDWWAQESGAFWGGADELHRSASGSTRSDVTREAPEAKPDSTGTAPSRIAGSSNEGGSGTSAAGVGGAGSAAAGGAVSSVDYADVMPSSVTAPSTINSGESYFDEEDVDESEGEDADTATAAGAALQTSGEEDYSVSAESELQSEQDDGGGYDDHYYWGNGADGDEYDGEGEEGEDDVSLLHSGGSREGSGEGSGGYGSGGDGDGGDNEVDFSGEDPLDAAYEANSNSNSGSSDDISSIAEE
jgi:hypothetical protein